MPKVSYSLERQLARTEVDTGGRPASFAPSSPMRQIDASERSKPSGTAPRTVGITLPPTVSETGPSWWQAPLSALYHLSSGVLGRCGIAGLFGGSLRGVLAGVAALFRPKTAGLRPGEAAQAGAALGAKIGSTAPEPKMARWSSAQVQNARATLEALQKPGMPRYFDLGGDGQALDPQIVARARILTHYYPALKISAALASESLLRPRIFEAIDQTNVPHQFRILLAAVPYCGPQKTRPQADPKPRTGTFEQLCAALAQRLDLPPDWHQAANDPFENDPVLTHEALVTRATAAMAVFISQHLDVHWPWLETFEDVLVAEARQIAGGRELILPKFFNLLKPAALEEPKDAPTKWTHPFGRSNTSPPKFIGNTLATDETLIGHFLRPQAPSVADGTFTPTHRALASSSSQAALMICTRLAELTSGQPEYARFHIGLRDWLRVGVSAPFDAPQALPYLARLARAVDVSLPDVTLLGQGLDARPLHAALCESCLGHAFTRLDAWLAAQRGATEPAAVLSCLRDLAGLLAPQEGVDVGQALKTFLALPMPPLTWSAMDDEARALFCAAVTSDNHVGLGAVYCATLLSDAVEAWPAVSRSLVHPPSEEGAKEWGAHLHALAGLSAAARSYVLADVAAPCQSTRFETLTLRLALATLAQTAGVDAYHEVLTRHPDIAPSYRAHGVIGAWHIHTSADPKAVYPLLLQLEERGSLTLDALMAHRRLFDNELLRPLRRAQATLMWAEGQALDRAIGSFIKIARLAQDPALEAYEAIVARMQQDERQIMPLDEAAALEDAQLPTARRGHRLVRVAGINIAVAPPPDGAPQPRPSNQPRYQGESERQLLEQLAVAVRRSHHPLLVGPASTGKTTIVRHLADLLGRSVVRVNLSPQTDVSDLIGRWTLAPTGAQGAPREPKWVDGPVLSAMRNGDFLLLDEINLASTQVVERLNQLLDDDRILTVQEHHSEVIRPHPNFRCFAAMNPQGYGGRRKMSPALQTRWQVIECPGPRVRDLQGVVAVHCPSIPEALRLKLVKAHLHIERTLAGKGVPAAVFSLRSLLRICRRYQYFASQAQGDSQLMSREAFDIYAGGCPDPETRDKIAKLLQDSFGGSKPGFMADVDVEPTQRGTRVGDVEVVNLQTGDPRVPTDEAAVAWTFRMRQLAYRVAKAWACGEHVALVGGKASGKTALVKYLSHLMGQPYHRYVLSPDTESSDLIGSWGLDGWHDGAVPLAGRCDRTPGVLLLDEMNLAPTSELERLNALLDDDRALTLPEKDGEQVQMHPHFRLIAAMNPSNGGYGGRHPLSEALLSRFTLIAVDEPDENEVAEVVAWVCQCHELPAWVPEAISELHRRAERFAGGSRHEPAVSLRDALAMARSVADLGEILPLREAFAAAERAIYSRHMPKHSLWDVGGPCR